MLIVSIIAFAVYTWHNPIFRKSMVNFITKEYQSLSTFVKKEENEIIKEEKKLEKAIIKEEKKIEQDIKKAIDKKVR